MVMLTAIIYWQDSRHTAAAAWLLGRIWLSKKRFLSLLLLSSLYVCWQCVFPISTFLLNSWFNSLCRFEQTASTRLLAAQSSIVNEFGVGNAILYSAVAFSYLRYERESHASPLRFSHHLHLVFQQRRGAAFGNQQTGSWNDDVITLDPASCHFSKRASSYMVPNFLKNNFSLVPSIFLLLEKLRAHFQNFNCYVSNGVFFVLQVD